MSSSEDRDEKPPAISGHGAGAGRPSARYWITILALVCAGGVLRFWYARFVSPPITTISDPWTYFFLGKHLAAGLGYIRPGEYLFQEEMVPTAEFPPLFPALVAALHLCGLDTSDVQKPVIATLGMTTVALVSELARRTGGTRVGLLAALLAAFSPTLVESDGAYMAEVLFVPLVAGSLLAALCARGRVAAWALAGGLAGAAALARAEALLLPVLLVPALFLAPARWTGSGRSGVRRRAALGCALLGGTLLVVLPWTARNGFAMRAFVPVSLSGYSALLGANCPHTYTGRQLGSWAFKCYELADGESLSEVATFARYRRTGLAYMGAHRDAWGRVIVARVARTFGLYRPGRWGGHGRPEGRRPAWSRPAMLAGLVLLALALVGAVRIGRRGPAQLLLLAAPVALALLTSVLAYGNPRFRLTAEPSILVLAALALGARGARAARSGGPGSLPAEPTAGPEDDGSHPRALSRGGRAAEARAEGRLRGVALELPVEEVLLVVGGGPGEDSSASRPRRYST